MFKYVLAFALVAAVSCDVSHLVRGQVNRNSGPEATARILRQESDIQPEGSYQWAYDTENGISADEQGNIRVLSAEEAAKTVQGGFKYTSPEGENIQVTYVADENGFQPQGAHLPVAPEPEPIPHYIQRALDWIAAHPQQPERKF